jgi:hypothetical protein
LASISKSSKNSVRVKYGKIIRLGISEMAIKKFQYGNRHREKNKKILIKTNLEKMDLPEMVIL